MRRVARPAFPLLALVAVACSDGGDGVTLDVDPPDDPPETENPTGGQVWLARFDGADTEEMESVIVTSDGGYLVTGTTLSAGPGGGDVWLVKVNADGSVAWQKAYGGSRLEVGYDAKQTPDGGFVVAGVTESFSSGGNDMWVFKTDAAGTVEWQTSYGGSGTEQAWSVDLTGDGGFVVAGGTTTFGAGGSDCLVLKLDASGDVVWQRAFGGPADDAPGGEYGEHVARAFEDRDGNIVVSTVTLSFGSGDSDVWVLKLDPAGEILWENAYGDEDEDGMWMIRESADGGYLVPGYFTATADYDTDLWALKLDDDGTVAWQKTYGVAGVYDEALSVGAAGDGGALIGGSYYEAGDADWSWTLTRVSADGALAWSRRYERGFDWPNAVAELDGGGFVVAGVTMSSLSDQEDLWLMKTAADGTIGGACEAVNDLTLSDEVTAVEPVATKATVTETDVVARSTGATVSDTDIGHTFDCSG